ncbi:MAG: glycoside hydrolase family 95 protein, partial [Clostridia bacterium]|nr:glycoside hydrolase family 95 protein [Clostridia bacterium]
ENSVCNELGLGGLNSFADIRFHFAHSEEVSDYERGLDLNRALAYVRYTVDGNPVERQYFTSYPDKMLVGKVTSGKPLSFTAKLEIPFLTEEEKRAKRGTVSYEGDTAKGEGFMECYELTFSIRLRVITDGTLTVKNGIFSIENATETMFLFCGKTSYVLAPSVFTESDCKKKLAKLDTAPLADEMLDAVADETFETLYARHEEDYQNLFGRVSLDLGETELPDVMTDELLASYGKGEISHYLEVLYFQFGRYLLISSSRKGCLPANLQGVWNCHDRSPWGSGYWHNINVQMNYWPTFAVNLAETFSAYLSYYEAFLPKASEFARDYIKYWVPEQQTDNLSECGWTIGTGNNPYNISGPGSHSGPGTGGLTSKLFMEYYLFTGDPAVLREVAYPAMLAMAKFLCRCVRDYDGKMLSVFSASPEQIFNGDWVPNRAQQYYQTIGCSFDQQMIWENAHDLLILAEKIGYENLPAKDLAFLEQLKTQIDRYDPVQVGWSGQIKEFREERFYGEYGEYHHRHISQLVGLYPGTLISKNTPAWFDAAKVSLDLRSDLSTGWALAHRLNAWARTGNGTRAYRLYRNLLGTKTLPTLWDTHAPFQIDGNFGGTSGVAEMLIQSHAGFIDILPCIPDDWDHGSFRGLCARGGYTVDAAWEGASATSICIKAAWDGICRLHSPMITKGKADFDYTAEDDDMISFAVRSGCIYSITDIPKTEREKFPANLKADHHGNLTWDFDKPVTVWRAVDSDTSYEMVASGVSDAYTIPGFDFDAMKETETMTFKVTSGTNPAAEGPVVTINHSTRLERDRYRCLVGILNHHDKTVSVCDYLGE